MIAALLLILGAARASQPTETFDVVVYESTPSGVIAAVMATRLGARTALISTTDHIGGVCSGGLGQTDVGSHADSTIGGLPLKFFKLSAATYSTPQPKAPWNLEPHVARDVFIDMMSRANVTVFTNAGYVRSVSRGEGGAISGVTVSRDPAHMSTSATTVLGRVFVDASYEGDLIAAANVSYTVGREANSTYNESNAGNLGKNDGHEFSSVDLVDPLDDNGKPLPYLITNTVADMGVPGEADTKVQSYNFRLCVTKDPNNTAPFPKPSSYNPDRWELLRRLAKIKQGKFAVPSGNTRPVPNGKFDCNNDGPISTDFVGGSRGYPEASPEERVAIWEAHKQYTLELFHFLQTDASVSNQTKADFAQWGLCKDEFVETGNWPPQLYVREGRRMVGDTVFTQSTIEANKGKEIGISSIGLGAYNYDSHTAQRIACTDLNSDICKRAGFNASFSWNEGDLERGPGLYQIPVTVLFPKRKESTNVLASVPVSASHVGYATLRMEPQFMIMGQAAGAVAALTALEDGDQKPVQDVNLQALRAALLQHEALVDLPKDKEIV